MEEFRVLFVCVGNVCRSPLGERLLASQLPAEGYAVSSAGVGAVVGAPIDPDVVPHLEAWGGSADGFAARQLTEAMVEEADLVLTATRDVRSRVLEEVPRAMRRTFTVRELAALLDLVDPEADPRALVAAASEHRSRAADVDLDVPDPHRRGPEAHARAAELVREAVERISKGLAA